MSAFKQGNKKRERLAITKVPDYKGNKIRLAMNREKERRQREKRERLAMTKVPDYKEKETRTRDKTCNVRIQTRKQATRKKTKA